MRKLYSVLFIFMALFMAGLPITAISQAAADEQPPADSASPSTQEDGGSFKLYRTSSGEVVVLSPHDYICGVVAAEMPADYESEALKAQAVASYTLACRQRDISRAKPDGSINNADFTDDPSTFQAYLSPDEVKEKFGDEYDALSQKIDDAVSAVAGKLITYNDEPIAAAFHAISAGKTESAANVWGSEVPYLSPVESVGDMLSPQYLSTAEFTPDEIRSAFADKDIAFTDDPDNWFTDAQFSDSGTVLSINLCSAELSGEEVRSALSLKSADFEVAYADGSFTFTVRGYGHGVGMSQNGAQFMAAEGSDYVEILEWYYKGCTVTDEKTA